MKYGWVLCIHSFYPSRKTHRHRENIQTTQKGKIGAFLWGDKALLTSINGFCTAELSNVHSSLLWWLYAAQPDDVIHLLLLLMDVLAYSLNPFFTFLVTRGRYSLFLLCRINAIYSSCLRLRRQSSSPANWKVGGSIPCCSSLHAKVSLARYWTSSCSRCVHRNVIVR